MVVFPGRCHCGNLELTLETSLAAERLPVRACACSFCVHHGARTTRDPAGRVRITIHDPAHLVRYRFGLRTADFLVCGRCGVYVAALCRLGDAAFATVNVNALDSGERFPQAVVVSYEGETAAERQARRAATWTPAVEVVGRPAP